MKNFKITNLSIPVLILLQLCIASAAYSTSPISNDGGTIGGVFCAMCTVENPNNSMDGNLNTYQNYELTAGALTYGETNYDFGSDIPATSIITLTVSFPDLVSNTFGGILASTVFENTEITFFDALDNAIYTYDASNNTAVEVLDDNLNLVAIKIINQYSNVRKIRFRSGGIASVVGDVRLHDLSYEVETFVFSDRNVDFGYFNGTSLVSLDLDHQIINPDLAVFEGTAQNFDVNSEYTSFKYLLNVNLGTEYLFAKYDWTGLNYSALDNDLYIMLEDANLIAVSDIKLLFDSDMIEILVGYSDGSSESFGNGNPLVSAETQVLGSGRFYLQIDIDDTKLISDVEIRFNPFVSLLSELRLYSIFLASPTVGNPLPVEFLGMDVQTANREATITWSTACESNCDYFLLDHLSADGDLIESYEVEGAGSTQNLSNYQLNIDVNLEELTYVQLSQVDFNGTQSMLQIESIIDNTSEIIVYPNPSRGVVNVHGVKKEELVLISEEGKFIQAMTTGENLIETNGKFFVIDASTGQNLETIIVVQ